MVYSTRRFVVCLYVRHFVLVFFCPFSIANTSLGEERANLNAFRTFVRFVLVWICLFPLPLGVWEGLRFVIVALLGLFSYLFYYIKMGFKGSKLYRYVFMMYTLLIFYPIINFRIWIIYTSRLFNCLRYLIPCSIFL